MYSWCHESFEIDSNDNYTAPKPLWNGQRQWNIFIKSTRKHITWCTWSLLTWWWKHFLKNCLESIIERKISDLRQQLPKSGEWQDFLSNHSNFHLTNLISDYLLEKASFSKDIYVFKGQFCYLKKNTILPLHLQALFSTHRGVDQKISDHVLFAIIPESVVFQMIPTFLS